MAEVKSLTAFTDKETGVFHQLGDLFTCGDARAKELADLGVVRIMTVEKAPAKTRKKTVKE